MALQTQTPKQMRQYYRQLALKWEELSQEIQASRLHTDAFNDTDLGTALTDADLTVTSTMANQLKGALATISTTVANNQANLTAALNAFLGLRTEG